MARFQKGQSGNPTGRPKGSKTAAPLRKMLESGVDQLIDKIKDQALAGDPVAQKMWIDRICPKVKPVDRIVKLPGLSRAVTLTEKADVIFSEIGKGTLTPAEGSTLISSLANQAKIIETDELTRRIEALENGDTEEQD